MSKPTYRRELQRRRRFAKERELSLQAAIQVIRINVSQRWQRQATRCMNAIEAQQGA